MEAGESSVELPGSERQILAGARRTGPTDRHEIAEVTVVLRRGSRAGPPPSLEELGRRPLRNRTHLTREEFAAAHGARAEDLEVVRSFTKSRGLNIVAEDPARRSVRISGTVE
ncbi:MAG: peptidase S53, partial [Thermoplasmata archaeon]|nr:peptidase S53 [Thermoplasmata archaeon]